MSRFYRIIVIPLCILCIGVVTVSASDNIWKIIPSPQSFIINGTLQQEEALNINGYNYMKIADVAKMLNIDITYNESANTVSFDKTKPYTEVRKINKMPINIPVQTKADISNLAETWICGGNPNQNDNLSKCSNIYSIEYKNISTDSSNTFALVDYPDYDILYPSFSNDKVTFGFYTNETIFNDESLKILSFLSQHNSIGDGAISDTKENREIISDVFRVYINNELILGELSKDNGPNYVGYNLLFDKDYSINDIQTIRIELGFIDN